MTVKAFRQRLLAVALLNLWGMLGAVAQPFLWAGNAEPNGVEVVAVLPEENKDMEVVAATVTSFDEEGLPLVGGMATLTLPVENGVARISLPKLPRRTKDVRVVVFAPGLEQEPPIRVPVFPKGPASFRFTLSSCSATGSDHPVFDQLVAEKPLFHLITGDFHYEDIDTNDPARFEAAYRANFASDGWRKLARVCSFLYMWDDHDYGPNNSDRTSPAREAALASYKQFVPHQELPLAVDGGPIAQAATAGRARIVMTDLRSMRDPHSQENASMMGEKQLAWFKKELLDAKANGQFVLWVSSVPWIAERGRDNWGGYPEERKDIANFIAENEIPLILLAGDAHMVALDDGTNNTYAGEKGFPVFVAAALDRGGSKKGGPYSHGMYPGGGQYGLVEINDEGGDTVEVRLVGKSADGSEITSYTHVIDLPKGKK